MGQEQRSEHEQGHAAGSAKALLLEALHFLRLAYKIRTGGDSTGTGLLERIRAFLDRAASSGSSQLPHGVGLRLYKCHKEVRAAKIIHIYTQRGDVQTLQIDGGIVSVTDAYMDKHQPHIGGYYVVYDDGYQSFSPAASFESGYTLLKPVTFSDIPEAGESVISARKCLACDVSWIAPVDTCPECGKSGQVTLP